MHLWPTLRDSSYSIDVSVFKVLLCFVLFVCYSLALGELGKDCQSVTLLDSAGVANPSEHLLLEWAMTDDGVTVEDLLEVLGRPSLLRMDIIGEIRTQMKSVED